MGATDSAAPCAMMLDLAESLNSLLDHRNNQLESGLLDDEEEDLAETTLQLVFFDGEEAFKDWTATDSVYGARLSLSQLMLHFFLIHATDIWQRNGPLHMWTLCRNGDYDIPLPK